jgi:hypothetical protein
MTSARIGKALRRRSLIAAAATAAAALAGLGKPQAAQAGVDGDLVLNTTNTGTATTVLTGNIATPLFRVSNGTGRAILGTAAGAEPAVRGEGGNGDGVQGDSVNGVGVLGNSATSYGLLGFSGGNLTYALSGSGSNNSHGVVGFSANQFGIAGINQSGGNWAGAFFSATNTMGLFVQGDLMVTGMKSSAYKTQRHGRRRLYAVEATECWFEDFGRARLNKGTARVDLDDVFNDTVNSRRDYVVSVTPLDAKSTGLAVIDQDENGFTVQELNGGTGNYPFTYRVSAKVKGEEARRLQQVETPAIPEPAKVKRGGR